MMSALQDPSPAGQLRHIDVRIISWDPFPPGLEQSVFYVTRQSFNASKQSRSTTGSSNVQFLAVCVEDADDTDNASRSQIIAFSPCDLLPQSTRFESFSQEDGAMEKDGAVELNGETWTIQNLYLRSGTCLPAVLVQPINLTRIVIAARCTRTHAELRKIITQGNFLQDVHQKYLIVRQGGSFYKSNSDAVVLKCEPVQQGLLGLSTEIVIAEFTLRPDGRRRKSSGHSGSVHHRNSLSMSTGAATVYRISSFKNLELFEKAAKFASSLLGSVNHLPVRKLALSASEDLLRVVADKFKAANCFSVSVLFQALIWKMPLDDDSRLYQWGRETHESERKDGSLLLSDQSFPTDTSVASKDFGRPETMPGGSWTEVDSIVFVSQSTFERLTSKNRAWFWASSQDERFRKRLVRLASLDWTLSNAEDSITCSDNDVFVNPLLWFNLNKHPSALVQTAASLYLSPAKELPKVFHTIRISLVRSPGVTDDDIERWYPHVEEKFMHEQIVRRGDVFAVAVPYTLPIQSTQHTVYFRVVDTEPSHLSCGLASKRKTFLFLCGVVSGYVPRAMDRYLPSPPRRFSDSPLSSLFDRNVTELATIFGAYSCMSGSYTGSQKIPSVLLHGDRGCGKRTIVNAVALYLNIQVYEINVPKHVIADTAAAMESRLQNQIEKAAVFAPCVVVFRHMDYLVENKEEPRVWKALSAAFRSLSENFKEGPVCIVGTCSTTPSGQLEDLFTVLHHIPAVHESGRRQVLSEFSESMRGHLEGTVNIQGIAARTTGFSLSDLNVLLEHVQWEAAARTKTICFPGHKPLDLTSQESLRHAGVLIKQSDFDSAQHHMMMARSSNFGSTIDASVTWDDIGGLEDVKREILRTIQLPLVCRQIRDSGMQRLGILLCGPPGNGKTLLVKVVAAQCSLNFISVKGPELINMYVGQSEENVRAVFERARLAPPCIIFFDEIDSLAPNRGRSGDSGGVVDRVVSQLMTEMDGLARNLGIFVFGATNRPDLVDSALLRPGRFDKIIMVKNPETSDARLQVLEAVLRKCSLSSSCDLRIIERSLPRDISGADLYASCAAAQLSAIGRLIGEGRLDDDPVIELCDFSCASSAF